MVSVKLQVSRAIPKNPQCGQPPHPKPTQPRKNGPPQPKPQPPRPGPPPHANARCSGISNIIVDRLAAAINATNTVVVRFITLRTDNTVLCIYRMLHSNC